MVNKQRMFLLVVLFAILCYATSGCNIVRPYAAKPVAVLTNQQGQKAAEFSALDTVYASFCGLRPDTRYDIRLLRSDGRRISHSSFRSDERGVIPTAALWWDVGVEYGKSRVGKLDLPTLYKHRYSCQLMRDKKVVMKLPVPIRPLDRNTPVVYSSDKNGNPLNGFVHRRENVYLTGKNLPPGSKLNVNVVPNSYSWEVGRRLDPVRREALVVQLDKRQRDFTTLVWPARLTVIGSYDIVVEYEAHNRIFDHQDLVDTQSAVGFTIFRLSGQPGPPPAPPPAHIETDLACQAPPQDPISGTVIGAPNPIYKDVFAPVEEVWVAVNPYAGGGNYVGESARLYVVNHLPKSGWTDGKTLTDVSGGFDTTVIQPGCANVNYSKVWSSPAINEYDVIVDFAPFGQYNIGTDIIDKLDDIGFAVPAQWVCLESISFNHASASSNADAINIRMNTNEDVIVPEWQKAKKPYPAAYIKSKNVTIKAVFTAGPGVNNFKIRAAVGYGSLGNVIQKTVTFPMVNPASFNLAAATPSQIKYFTQKWDWYCGDINGTGSPEVHIASSKNKIFVVLAQPQAPWTASGQSKPWVSVLQKSCWWANGQTTPEGAAERIQHHLYEDLGGSYVYGSQYTGKTTADFDMSAFLNNIPSIGLVNCYDMGKSLVGFSNVVGCGLTYKLSQPFGSLYCEKAIGCNWNCSEAFSNHGFGNISDNVFDACLKVDTDSNPAAGPPYTETWMTNEPWNSYNQKVVKNAAADTPVPYAFNVK